MAFLTIPRLWHGRRKTLFRQRLRVEGAPTLRTSDAILIDMQAGIPSAVHQRRGRAVLYLDIDP